MKKQRYQRLGALWRVPLVQRVNVLAVTIAVIGMVTYVGMYNPRAALASDEPPAATARAAPAGPAEPAKPTQTIAHVGFDDAYRTFHSNTVDLSVLTTNFSSTATDSTLSTAADQNMRDATGTLSLRTIYGTPLESNFAIMVHNRIW